MITSQARDFSALVASAGSSFDVVVHGTPGDWSVCYRSLAPGGDGLVWLASARAPGEMRRFKTLEAVYSEVSRLALLSGVEDASIEIHGGLAVKAH